jgi:hypothetical protein
VAPGVKESSPNVSRPRQGGGQLRRESAGQRLPNEFPRTKFTGQRLPREFPALEFKGQRLPGEYPGSEFKGQRLPREYPASEFDGQRLPNEFPSRGTDDGKRHKILDGKHYVTATPYPRHQAILGGLHFWIGNFLRQNRLGRVFFAPVDVLLSKHDIVQPDTAAAGDLLTTPLLPGLEIPLVEVFQ